MVYRTPRIARVARTSAARRARATPFASRALAAFAVKARAFGAPLRTRAERLRLAATPHPASAMPFWASASSRSDAPRDPRPARGSVAVWDHDPEGDAFVPPPPDTLPASLRPPRSNDAWLLDAGSCAGLVRRGRHAPARDGSESPDVRRLRVRLAQLEPVLDDARRDARLADRARRTAEAERDQARAALAAARRDASEAIEEARAAFAETEAAREETKTAREETRAFRDERDALKRSAAVFEAEAIRREKETEAALAEMERRLREREREVVDAGTETASDSFGDGRSDEERVAAEIRSATRDAYEAGSRDGERRGREATLEALEASAAARLLAEAARDAAHARAADAEARVATLAARLERARANEAAERKRAAAAEARRNEHETLSRLKASDAADALAAAETREGVFRARLEALARNPPLVARHSPRMEREPTGPPRAFFCDARRAPAKTSPEDVSQKKKPSSASSFARVETLSLKKKKGNPAPFAKKRAALGDDHLSSEEPRDENARSLREEKEKQTGELPDWLPEVRPPPRMLA